jgi:hypothetical protein
MNISEQSMAENVSSFEYAQQFLNDFYLRLTMFTGYCGNALATTSNATANSDCSMVCAGNVYEYCGAGNRLSTYQLTV